MTEEKVEVVSGLAQGASLAVSGKTAGRVLLFAGQVILARFLGPAQYGLYTVGWIILRIVSHLGPLGLEVAVVRFGSRALQSDDIRWRGVLSHAITLTLISGTFFAGAVAVGSHWLSELFLEDPALTSVLRWFALAIVLASAVPVLAAATRLSQRMQYSVVVEDLTQPLANLLLIVVFFIAGGGLLAAIVACVVSFGLAVYVGFYFMGKLFPDTLTAHRVSISTTWEMLSFSVPASMARLFSLFNLWIDRLIVAYYLTSSDLGVYQAAAQVALVFSVVLAGFGAILSPMIAEAFGFRPRAITRVQELFRLGTKWGLYVCLPFFVPIFFMPREILGTVFGREYEAGWLALVILSVSQLINVAKGHVGYVLVMAGREKQWFLISTVALFVNAGLNFALIPYYGILGAALSTVAAVALMSGLGLFEARRSIGVWPYDKKLLKGILSTTVAAVFVFAVSRTITSSGIVTLSIAVVVSGLSYCGTLWLLGLDREDHQAMELIRRMLKIPGSGARFRSPDSE